MAGAVAFSGTVDVQGLAEFQAAMRELEVGITKQLHEGLKHVSEPVAETSHDLADSNISGMKRRKEVDWSEFRIGQTPGMTYVAPQIHRGRTKRKRPNLATLLVVKAMEPAAVEQHDRVELGLSLVLQEAFTRAGV